MRFRNPVRRRILFGFAGVVISVNVAVAKTFTGAFQGQGEACWGNLYIRTKTLEWDTDYSICRSKYTIIAQHYMGTPHQDYDFIIYKVDHVARTCHFPYIGLYFFRNPGDVSIARNDWSVAGFEHYSDYETFDYRSHLNGTYTDLTRGVGTVLFCDLPQYGP